MGLGNVRDEDREENLNCIFIRLAVCRSVEETRNIPAFLLIIEGNKSIHKVLVLFLAILCHFFVA